MGVLKIIILVLILIGMYALVHKALPRLFVFFGRKMGFRLRMSPIWEKRIARFKTIKRGYYAFLIITTLFATSLFVELLINNKALVIHYNGKTAFPALANWLDTAVFFTKVSYFEKKSDFGQIGKDEVNYRRFRDICADPDQLLKDIPKLEKELEEYRMELQDIPPPDDEYATEEDLEDYKDITAIIKEVKAEIIRVKENHEVYKAGKAWILMPLYPYAPHEHLLEEVANPPTVPDRVHLLGTDDAGVDVLTFLFYGFRISLAFALLVATVGYSIGVVVGGIMGYFGGWTDILTQRFIEIWGSIPFLFTIMILASIMQPKFIVLALLMILLRSWIGITYTIRGEFYREKAKDYVQAAIGIGSSDWKVMIHHILPNSLVPVVSFAPFAIVAYIGSLVSLDYLGFGLPVGTPSWGALINQGLQYIKLFPHLILVPCITLAFTLFSVVMIGEAVREAFDPKVFSRLR
jgi:microcin C transport system permease protein